MNMLSCLAILLLAHPCVIYIYLRFHRLDILVVMSLLLFLTLCSCGIHGYFHKESTN